MVVYLIRSFPAARTVSVTPDVSGSVVGATKTYAKIGDDVVLSCTGYGSGPTGSTATWYNGATRLLNSEANSDVFQVTPGVAFENKVTIKYMS